MTPLTIAIDARELAGRPTGVGAYVIGVLREWAATGFPHRLHLIAHQDLPEEVTSLPLDLTVTIHQADTAGTLWEQTVLPRAIDATRAGVALAPAYTAALRTAVPTVLIVHDVSYFAQPDGYRWREGVRRRWLTRASVRRAARVLTVSQFSAREIATHLGVEETRIIVASQGAPAWSGDERTNAGADVLYVGTLFTRRHIPELIEAFARVAARRADATLTLIGQNQTQPPIDPMAIAAHHGVAPRVTWHPYVSGDALDTLYRRARAFAFLSDYEGFGMTPVEAAARGVPSVVLDTEVAREIYADGAVFVPLATDAVSAALLTLLDDDAQHREVVARARARLAHFRWSDTARIVREALEGAARR